MAQAIEPIAADYDSILIDCPPNLYLATQNALYASDGYLVTLMPDHFSTVGVTFLDRKIKQLLRERKLSEQIINPAADALRELQYFLCFVKANVTAGRMQLVAKEQMATVRSMPHFAGSVFESRTEDYKDIREATTEQLPVYLNSPGSQNDLLYREMTKEFRLKFPLT